MKAVTSRAWSQAVVMISGQSNIAWSRSFGSSFLRRLPRPDNVVLVDGLRAVWALLSQVDVAE